MMMEPVFNYDKVHLAPRFARGTLALWPDEPDPKQFLRAADHMADCTLEDKNPRLEAEEGLRDMELMAQIYRACERRSA